MRRAAGEGRRACGDLEGLASSPRPAAAASTAAAAVLGYALLTAAPGPALAAQVDKRLPPSAVLEELRKEEREEEALGVLGRLRLEEKEFQREEKEVQKEMDAPALNPLQWLLNKAKLLNLKAVLTDEEAAVREEEVDVQKADKVKLKKDINKLEGLEKIESKLRFSGEENKELDDLERLLLAFPTSKT